MIEIENCFQRVGALLDARWQKRNYAREIFPEYAASALHDLDDFGMPSVEQIYDWILTAADIPRQIDLKANFSQPPLTVFRNDRFHIGFLFWTTSTTSIHQHSFEGAFKVFHGSSIQATYEFSDHVLISERMKTGALSLKTILILRKGDVCRISRGKSFIHSLYHLDHPSVTLIIRTHDPDGPIQFSYEWPGIATDPFFKTERLTRTLQFLTHLHEIRHDNFEPLAAASVAARDSYEQYRILRLLDHLRPQKEMKRLLTLTRPWDSLFEAALKERRRQRRLIAARHTVLDAKRRFFLSLLLNVPTRKELVKLVANTGEAEPEEFIRKEISQLCRDKTLGISDEGLTGVVMRGLLASPLNEMGSCFEGSALEPLAKEIRSVFHPLFSESERP